MRTRFSKLALMVTVALAFAFTFSCSSDDSSPSGSDLSSSSGGGGFSSSSSSDSDITYPNGLNVKGDAKGSGANICIIRGESSGTEMTTLCGTEVAEYIEFYIIDRAGSNKYPLTAANQNCMLNSTNELTCYGGINLVNGTAKVDVSNITGLTGTWYLYAKIIDGKITGDPVEPMKIATITPMTMEPED